MTEDANRWQARFAGVQLQLAKAKHVLKEVARSRAIALAKVAALQSENDGLKLQLQRCQCKNQMGPPPAYAAKCTSDEGGGDEDDSVPRRAPAVDDDDEDDFLGSMIYHSIYKEKMRVEADRVGSRPPEDNEAATHANNQDAMSTTSGASNQMTSYNQSYGGNLFIPRGKVGPIRQLISPTIDQSVRGGEGDDKAKSSAPMLLNLRHDSVASVGTAKVGGKTTSSGRFQLPTIKRPFPLEEDSGSHKISHKQFKKAGWDKRPGWPHKHEGSIAQSQNVGLCQISHNVERGPIPRLCKHDGCINQAYRGGVCKDHEGKDIEISHRCNHEGCDNISEERGFCKRHVPKSQICSTDGCTRPAKVGTVCVLHIEVPKICRLVEDRKAKEEVEQHQCEHEGCAELPWAGGFCKRHGAKLPERTTKGSLRGAWHKACSIEGCARRAGNGGVCCTHGYKRKLCSHPGCVNQMVKGGVCNAHGAAPKKCTAEGCDNNARKGGVCASHGARYECIFEGCTKAGRKQGLCLQHWKSLPDEPCTYVGCNRKAQFEGLCIVHLDNGRKRLQLEKLHRST